MPVSGAGVYTRVHDWTADEAGAINIEASRMDAEMDDQATAFNLAFWKDGRAPMTGTLDMNTQRIDLDADNDTSIRSSADDLIDFEVAGVDVVRFGANGAQILTSADAGAGAGPVLTLLRDSASPAPSDILGRVEFAGRDSGGTDTPLYGMVQGGIVTATDAAEDGEVVFATAVAGSTANRLVIRNGVYTAGATGGDQGADTINASSFYVDGVLALDRAQSFASKASDTARSSDSTPSDDPDLSLTLAANATYRIEAWVVANCASAVPDIQFVWSEPDGTWLGYTNSFALRSTGDDVSIDESSAATTFQLNAGVDAILHFTINAITGGAGGAFTFQWAQGVSNATAVTVLAGSWMRALRIN